MKNKKVINIIIILLLTIVVINIIPKEVYADFNTGDYADIKPGDTNILKNRFSGVWQNVQLIGSFASVILLIVIGIKYMISSVEERAQYKNTMAAYIIGAVFIFSIIKIIDLIMVIGGDLVNSGDIETVGGKLVTILSTIGSIISIIVIAILGIKYMSGGIEEKAVYKSTMVPYLVGAVIVFAASSLAGMVYNIVTQLG